MRPIPNDIRKIICQHDSDTSVQEENKWKDESMQKHQTKQGVSKAQNHNMQNKCQCTIKQKK